MIDREFRVGDKVTCNVYGIGEVVGIGDFIYGVVVRFKDNIIRYYSQNGKVDIDSKRTLFIIPKQNPTNEEILNKFNELVNNTPEVYFIPNEKNYYVEGCFYCEENKYVFYKCFNTSNKFLRTKYINKIKADSILTELNNFIKGE